jgi:type II secretory pathway component GspD/PulD (secretin)
LQVILSALASKGNVGIASQPLLLVNDNEEASFSTKVSQPTTTVSQGTATTNTSFGGFADATTSVKITPHISPDGYVNLEINQTFEEFQGSSPGAGIPPPKVSNTTSTKVTIPDKQTIVIGGFTRDSAEDTRSGIPGLMQIPGLGRLFSKETKTKTASRLYLFVRPKILAMAGFEDLQQESGRKKTDLDQLTRKSRIRNEIDERVGKKDETGPILPLRVPEEEKARE